MASYSGKLLKVNGKEVKKLISYKTQYNKLWADDTGRNIAGVNKGTLVGIFPKLLLQFGSMDEEEMAEFLQWANLAEITVEWYDAETKGTRTASYYSNSPEIDLKSTSLMKYKSFSFNLIPNQKR